MDNTQLKLSVSYATVRNWNKLKTEVNGRLESRANKRKSKKRILPLEYFCNLSNVDFIQHLLDIVDELNQSVSAVVFSLGINKLKRHNIYHLQHVQNVLNEYAKWNIIEEIVALELPLDEVDIIGLFYQSYLYEGKKNVIGSYYTPRKIVRNMIKSFDFSEGQTVLDPCCGSGAFLLEINATNTEQIFGIDNDEIAVFIAKINMLVKYADKIFSPQIFCLDFLSDKSMLQCKKICSMRFDYIATNPPWGAMSSRNNNIIFSSETFSFFFVRAFEYLAEYGTIRFLFPESILNVKMHKDIRRFMLRNTQIVSVTAYSGMFSGVTTKYIDIECSKATQKEKFVFYDDTGSREISVSSIYETENTVFNFMDTTDILIIQRVKSKGSYSLKDSIWGLGVVTGDNKNKLFSTRQDGMEKIYTGKEICPYLLKPANKYLLYNRQNLQQVAKEEVYRADEKLVYKFISNKLVFAYDDSRSLFLNSANILIPHIPNMSIKTAMAFLNSELFQFLYMKMFGEVKVLKGNLMELPFPCISPKDDSLISSKVDLMLRGEIFHEVELQNIIYSIYGLTNEQIQYIRRTINGKTD